jgi:hypothetical protein
MGREQVALHRQQHDVHRHVARHRLGRVVEQFLAVAHVDELARRRHRTLRGQSIGDQDDLVGLRVDGARRDEGIDQAGAVTRHDVARGGEHIVDGARIVRIQPLALGVGDHGLGLHVETVDLELAVGRQLRADPLDHVDGAAPLGRELARGFGLVAQPDHLDHVVFHHARRSVEQHQDAFALDAQ